MMRPAHTRRTASGMADVSENLYKSHTKDSDMTEKHIRILGTVGSIMAVAMYVAYIPQISANLSGTRQVGLMELLQPLVASVNCTIWVAYGLFKTPRDWPIAVANAPGVVFGLIAFLTGL